MRYKSRSDGVMGYLMRWTKRTFKQVCWEPLNRTRPGCRHVHGLKMLIVPPSELDALGLDDELIGEGETPSYLQDAVALPDFVDGAPMEENHVSLPPMMARRLLV